MNSIKKFCLFVLCFALYSLNATVYQPGMWFYYNPDVEAIDVNKNPSIAALDGVVPCQGVFMEYTDSSIAIGVPAGGNAGSGTNLYDNAVYTWRRYEMFGYEGLFFVENGKTYTISKDHGRYMRVVVDGQQLFSDYGWFNHPNGKYTATKTGFVNLEVRGGINGENYIGPLSQNFGTGYNTEGLNFNGSTWGRSPWMPFIDPGDGSLLRIVKSETDYMVMNDVAVDGDDLIISATFTGVPSEGVLTALYGNNDGGEVSALWGNEYELATISVGDTATTQFRVPGGAAMNYVALRLQRTDYATEPYLQFSEVMTVPKATPIFNLENTIVGYSNLVFNATIGSCGTGADSIDACIQISTDEAFSNIVKSEPLTLTSVGNETLNVVALSSNTVYYARIYGTNNNGQIGTSGTVGPVCTLTPTAAVAGTTGVPSTLGALSTSITVTDFGDDSNDAQACIEASVYSNFADVSASSEFVDVPLNTPTVLTVSGLQEGEEYYYRTKIVNSWGIVTYTPVVGPVETKYVPFTASDVIWSVETNGTLTVSINIFAVEWTADAKLTIGGIPVSPVQSFSEPGVITWTDIAAPAVDTPVVITLSAEADGNVYEKSYYEKDYEATIIPGLASWKKGWEYYSDTKSLRWTDRMGFENVLSNVNANANTKIYTFATSQQNNALALNLDFSVGFVEEGWSLEDRLPNALSNQYTTNFVFPAGTKSVAHGFFENREALRSVTFNEGLLDLGVGNSRYNTFANASALETISEFPKSITNIGNGFCNNCTSLKGDIEWPAMVTRVPTYAFTHTQITSMRIPKGVTHIGPYNAEGRMFSWNSMIKDIWLPETLVYVSGRMFSDTGTELGVNVWYSNFPTQGWHKFQFYNTSNNTITNYFEWRSREQYYSYAETNQQGFVFTFPETYEGTGTWKDQSNKIQIIRWWRNPDLDPPMMIIIK